MNIITAWRARCADTIPELEQALIRLMLWIVVMLFLWVSLLSRPDERDATILTGLAAWFAASIGLLLAIWMWPEPSVTRRVLGILADVGAVTFALFFMGESGVIAVGAYFFITFGHGFRYGRAYFYVSEIFCLIGFILVLSMAPWWQGQRIIGVSLMVWLVILPVYVGTLVERMRLELRRAKDALKECAEARTTSAS